MAWKALLDDAGVLVGFDPTGQTGTVEVPDDCDLVPGRYCWNAAAARFDPIRAAIAKPLPGPVPDQVVAIALAIRAIGRTIPLPGYTQEWLRQFDLYPDDWSR